MDWAEQGWGKLESIVVATETDCLSQAEHFSSAQSDSNHSGQELNWARSVPCQKIRLAAALIICFLPIFAWSKKSVGDAFVWNCNWTRRGDISSKKDFAERKLSGQNVISTISRSTLGPLLQSFTDPYQSAYFSKPACFKRIFWTFQSVHVASLLKST